jgi:hypothetical protein
MTESGMKKFDFVERWRIGCEMVYQANHGIGGFIDGLFGGLLQQ